MWQERLPTGLGHIFLPTASSNKDRKRRTKAMIIYKSTNTIEKKTNKLQAMLL